MNSVVLTEEEAPLPYKVFKKGDDDDSKDAQSAESSEELGAQNEKKVEKDIIQKFKHTFVPEVVREPKMHFKKVPRLSCCVAVPLVYNSYLFNESLESAVENF